MSLRALIKLPASLLILLSVAPLTRCECYVAAYGLIGKQDGWDACPGTATSAGGAEICCLPGSECGEDSICHVPASQNPGDNAYYVAGCTDSSHGDSVCNNVCEGYTQTYIQYEDSTQKWMCCGNGGCNGTVTDDTFSGISPDDFKAITGSAAASSPATSPATTLTSATSTKQTTITNSSPAQPSTTPASSNVGTSSSNADTSKKTTTRHRTAAITSGDFKPSPFRGSTGAGASATPGADTSSSSQDNSGNSSSNNDGGLSTGAQAGIGIAGGVAGLALIVGLVAIFMIRRNKKSKGTEKDEVRPKYDTATAHSSLAAPPYSSSSTYDANMLSELHGLNKPTELPTNSAVFEVGGAENEVQQKHWRPW